MPQPSEEFVRPCADGRPCSVPESSWIRFWDEPGIGDEPGLRDQLGAKGEALYRLSAAGLPVAPGFTITTAACTWYHAHDRQWPADLWPEVEAALERLQAAALPERTDAQSPLRFAVRSGAPVSMPGLMATCLNVEPARLRESITAVFDSWESTGVRQFRNLRGWSATEGSAVTIQVMFPVEVSGVLFTISPDQGEPDSMTVEVVPGSGTELVSGRATPLVWRVDRSSHRILGAPAEASLEDAHLRRFATDGLPRLCGDVEQIEKLFGRAVDIEFGYGGGRLTYFQARPIVAPPALLVDVEQFRTVERTRLLDWARQGRRWWIRHNLSETLPAPTPLTWDLWRRFMRGSGGFGQLYRRLGYRPSALVCREGFLELIAGRIYADPDRLPEMFCAGYPFTFESSEAGTDPGVLERGPTRLDLERLDPWFLLRWPLILWTLARSRRRQQRLGRDAAIEFDGEFVPRLRSRVAQEQTIELERLPLTALIAQFERRRRWVFDELAPAALLPGMLGAAAWGDLEQRLRTVLGARTAVELLTRLLAGNIDPVLRRQRALFERWSDGSATIDEVLCDIGHRGPDEMDLSSPRWRERPEALQQIATASNNSRRVEAVALADDSRDNDLLSTLNACGASCLHQQLAPLLQRASTLLPYRETGKDEFLRGYELLRDVLQELSVRTGLGDGVYCLTVDEIGGLAANTNLEQVVAERRASRSAALALELPSVLELQEDMQKFDVHLRAREPRAARSAVTLSGGRATGTVCRIAANGSFPQSTAGAVIVAPTINPGLTPFLVNAAAIVVEQGGQLSHVALLTRQLGIPAVVAPGITGNVADGEAITVDADRGLIEVRDRLL